MVYQVKNLRAAYTEIWGMFCEKESFVESTIKENFDFNTKQMWTSMFAAVFYIAVVSFLNHFKICAIEIKKNSHLAALKK